MTTDPERAALAALEQRADIAKAAGTGCWLSRAELDAILSLAHRTQQADAELKILEQRHAAAGDAAFIAHTEERNKREAAEAEAGRLREALEFYASPGNWQPGDGNAIDDEGDRARAALRPDAKGGW